MADEALRRLADSMSADDVLIYTQPDCAYCESAKRWLDAHGFKYTECDIGLDPGCAAAYRKYGAIGTPYLVVRRHGNVRHLRNGFASAEFLAALQ